MGQDATGRRVNEFWDTDQYGWDYPSKLIGKTFLHAATSKLYVVVEAMFDATGDQWCIVYERVKEEDRKPFRFVRSMSEFMAAGRFVEVE